MEIKRRADAQWLGNGMKGKGTLTTHSKVLSNTPYAFNTRFEHEKGTNPEELIAAAHAGCFSMKLAFVLQDAGFTAKVIDTYAVAVFEDGEVRRIDLSVEAEVEGISKEDFEKYAEEAKNNCPISLLLKAEIRFCAELKA